MLARALTDLTEPLRLSTTISPGWQAIVLVLTLCAVLLALCRLRPLELLQIGRPEMTIKGLE